MALGKIEYCSIRQFPHPNMNGINQRCGRSTKRREKRKDTYKDSLRAMSLKVS